MKSRNPGAEFNTRVKITKTMLPKFREWASQWELAALGVLELAGFKPQHQFQIGTYSADIAFPRRKLAIEINGRNHKFKKRRKREEQRDRYMQSAGWRVVKINQPRRQGPDGFLKRVLEAAQ